MKITLAINVGILVDGDGEGAVGVVHSHHISAGMAVVLCLDHAPFVGGINFLAYLKPFTVRAVEVVDMARDSADQVRKDTSGILLGGREP